jgi:hypothetical protein
MRDRFTRQAPTNKFDKFEFLEYHWDFNEYFIELCDLILNMFRPEDNGCRNIWEEKKRKLKLEQRSILDEQWPILQDMPEEERNTKMGENIGRVNNLDRELQAVEINNIQEGLSPLANIMHLCCRQHRDRRELWLGIHFGSISISLEYQGTEIDQEYCEYTLYLKESHLIVNLSNVEIIIDNDNLWQIGRDTPWKVELHPKINENQEAIWKFTKNDSYAYLNGQCRSKKIGTLNLVNRHQNIARNIKCSLQLRTTFLYIATLLINRVDVEFNNKKLWMSHPEDNLKRQKYLNRLDNELYNLYNFSGDFIPIEVEVRIDG